MIHTQRLLNRRVFAVSHLIRMIVVLAVSSAALNGTKTMAQAPAGDDVKVVKPFVRETTCVVLKVDPSRIKLPLQWGELDAMPPTAKAAVKERLQVVDDGLGLLQAHADGKPFFLTMDLPISATRVPIYAFREKTSEQDAKRLINLATDQFGVAAEVSGNYVVLTPPGEKATPQQAAEERGSLAEAVGAVAAFPAYALILPPEYVRRTIREVSPNLPPFLGGGPSSVLVEGCQWAAIGLDVEKLRAEVIIQSASEQAAAKFAEQLPAMLSRLHESAPATARAQLPEALVQSAIGLLKPQVRGSRITITIDGLAKDHANLSLLAAIASVVEARTRRITNRDRFRQILLAFHNYHSANRSLPSNKNGLSWRVHLLPYLEGGQAIYERFHLDEPWDSPHNKPLVKEIPEIYAPSVVGQAQDKLAGGLTTIQAPVGENTVFGGEKATRFGQIIDGLSNTLVVLEVSDENGVPWSAPEDFEFDAANPLDGVYIDADGKWSCASGDGAFHRLRSDVPPASVLHLFGMNDREDVNIRDLH